MEAPFTVDSSLFTRKSLALLRLIEKSEEEFLEEQAGLLFRDVAKFTPPFAGGQLPTFGRDSYGTGKDRKAGEIAVRRDVRRSMEPVAPPSKWRSPRIRKAVRARDTDYLEEMFKNAEGSSYQGFSVSLFDSAFHSRSRDSRGRVNRSKKRLVLTKAVFDRYLRRVLSRVGHGKAHFALAAMRMGRKTAPKWISRHFGSARVAVRKGPGFVQAGAASPAFVHTLRFLPKIEQVRAGAAEKRLEFLLKQDIKGAGFRAA